MSSQAEEHNLSTADMAHAVQRREETQEAADTDVVAESHTTSTTTTQTDFAPLFAEEDAQKYRSRWSSVQTGFVDDPRQAVQEADGLVAEVMQKIAQGFADERANLEQQWDRGEDISTEDLRVALQRYRSFFDRLLSL